MPTEADTCRKFVVPKLQAAGWDNDPHSIAEQRSITDGRIIPVGKGLHPKAAEAGRLFAALHARFSARRRRGEGGLQVGGRWLQQAKTYAEMLGLKFAYATNGHEIIEYDYSPGSRDASVRLSNAGRIVAALP